MDFTLTDEHVQAQKMVRDFCAKEVIPTIGEWDRKQEMDPETLPRMGELGILGINIPVRYGGQGFDYITLGLVCEELERADTTLRVVMSVHMVIAMGNGGAKTAIPDSAGARREIRWLLPDGTGRWERCSEYEIYRYPQRRYIHPEW
jgi:alkylation response protein AidB-like acyl-CoA dehydrogenase